MQEAGRKFCVERIGLESTPTIRRWSNEVTGILEISVSSEEDRRGGSFCGFLNVNSYGGHLAMGDGGGGQQMS